jgi:hypothetical protein
VRRLTALARSLIARHGKAIIANPLAPAGFNGICALDRPSLSAISLHWLCDSSAHCDSFAVRVTSRASRSRARPRFKRTAALSVKATAHSFWSLNNYTLHTPSINCADIPHFSYNLDLILRPLTCELEYSACLLPPILTTQPRLLCRRLLDSLSLSLRV